MHTRSRYLASGGKWSEKIGDQLRDFLRDLAELVEPIEPERAKSSDLAGAFRTLGIATKSGATLVLDQPFPGPDARPSFPGSSAPGRS